jgi:DNA-binding NtrC family response regulator
MFEIMGEILRDTIHQGRKEDTDIREFVGTSEAISEIRKLIVTCSMEVDPLLVTGETGTGKNYVAELIHNYSPTIRQGQGNLKLSIPPASRKAFLKANCSAIKKAPLPMPPMRKKEWWKKPPGAHY